MRRLSVCDKPIVALDIFLTDIIQAKKKHGTNIGSVNIWDSLPSVNISWASAYSPSCISQIKDLNVITINLLLVKYVCMPMSLIEDTNFPIEESKLNRVLSCTRLI